MSSPVREETPTRLVRRSKSQIDQSLSVDPVIGKDILELLSSSMYVDPRAIYREYLQNAADAIDEAFDHGLLGANQFGRVDLSFDALERSVTIRDNGAGIPASRAQAVLTSFGASTERGRGVRGF